MPVQAIRMLKCRMRFGGESEALIISPYKTFETQTNRFSSVFSVEDFVKSYSRQNSIDAFNVKIAEILQGLAKIIHNARLRTSQARRVLSLSVGTASGRVQAAFETAFGETLERARMYRPGTSHINQIKDVIDKTSEGLADKLTLAIYHRASVGVEGASITYNGKPTGAIWFNVASATESNSPHQSIEGSVRTLIHEMTHEKAQTKDYFYVSDAKDQTTNRFLHDVRSLGDAHPDHGRGTTPTEYIPAMRIKNADTYGFFVYECTQGPLISPPNVTVDFSYETRDTEGFRQHSVQGLRLFSRG